MKNQSTTGRRKRIIMFLLLVTILIIMVILLPPFRLSEIKIYGLLNISDDEIIDVSGLETGQHLFAGLGGSLDHWLHLRYKNIEDDLQRSFPAIQSVQASFSYPGSLEINITERIEVAYIAIPDGCVMIDKYAVAMRIDSQPPDGIPLIEGITSRAIVLGQTISVDVPDALNSAITLMGAIIDADRDDRADISLLTLISNIRPVSGRRLYLSIKLPDSGEELIVLAETGRGQLDDMIWLRLALEQGVLGNRGRGILDLSGGRRTFTPE